VEQELLTLPEPLSSPHVFRGVRVTRSLVLCVYVVDRCLSIFCWPLFCLFFFDIRILITHLVSSKSSCLFVYLFFILFIFFIFWHYCWYSKLLCDYRISNLINHILSVQNISNVAIGHKLQEYCLYSNATIA
jgi:hypothetical protein